jgi:hypothetical protein
VPSGAHGNGSWLIGCRPPVRWMGIFEQIDAGEVPLGGDDGLLKGLLRAALERGGEVELTDHVG